MLQHSGGPIIEQEAADQRLLWASTEASDRPKAWLARVRRAAVAARSAICKKKGVFKAYTALSSDPKTN